MTDLQSLLPSDTAADNALHTESIVIPQQADTHKVKFQHVPECSRHPSRLAMKVELRGTCGRTQLCHALVTNLRESLPAAAAGSGYAVSIRGIEMGLASCPIEPETVDNL